MRIFSRALVAVSSKYQVLGSSFFCSASRCTERIAGYGYTSPAPSSISLLLRPSLTSSTRRTAPEDSQSLHSLMNGLDAVVHDDQFIAGLAAAMEQRMTRSRLLIHLRRSDVS